MDNTINQPRFPDHAQSLVSDSVIDLGDDLRRSNFRQYLAHANQARFVIRKVVRILTDVAKRNGLDGMEHQALLQVASVPGGQVPIHVLAERLDIVPAFASRLVKQLEARALIRRSRFEADKRVTLTSVTDAAMTLLRQIDEEIHFEVAYFQKGLSAPERMAALSIFAFYVGEPQDSDVASAIRASLDQTLADIRR